MGENFRSRKTSKLKTMGQIILEDPSQQVRPDDPKFQEENPETHRDYSKGGKHYDRVHRTYHQMHTNQTVEYGKQMRNKWLKFDKIKLNVMDAMEKLNDLVDESDPDADFPNIYHAYQTAEGIREKYPDRDWMQLTGFLHDLGKMMCFYGQPQWSTVGDIYPVGCKPEPSVVYVDDTFDECPDQKDARYNTKFGMYKEHCGLENVQMSWGHDEYLYQVLIHNNTTLPQEALYMIRYHSFYPWHTGGDYTHLTTEKDEKMKPLVKLFSNFDLYTKCENLPDIEKLQEYYQKLIDKYIPGVLEW